MQTLAANVNNIPALGAFNDLYLDGDGNIIVSYDLQAVLEACAQAASTLLGEMVLNTDQGIPYFQTLWNGVPNVEQWSAAVRVAWLAVPNVIEVVSLVTSQVDDVFTYAAVINTTFGTGIVNGGL